MGSLPAVYGENLSQEGYSLRRNHNHMWYNTQAFWLKCEEAPWHYRSLRKIICILNQWRQTTKGMAAKEGCVMLTFEMNNLPTTLHYECILCYQDQEYITNQFMQLKTNSIFSAYRNIFTTFILYYGVAAHKDFLTELCCG